MPAAPPDILEIYARVLQDALVTLRFRVLCGESVSGDELRDLMDALENVPEMLRSYGNWHVEENIDAYLARYDELWMGKPGSAERRSLVRMLERAKASSPKPPAGGG